MGERATLQENMQRLAEGERDAFDAVFEELWPLFRGFARRHVGPTESEDVAQSALLKLFARAHDFDSRRDALAWALGVVAWETRTARKRGARRRETPDDALAAIADGNSDPEALAIRASDEARLAEALARLGPADREALLASARGERPAGATFRKRVQRALARLRVVWGQP